MCSFSRQIQRCRSRFDLIIHWRDILGILITEKMFNICLIKLHLGMGVNSKFSLFFDSKIIINFYLNLPMMIPASGHTIAICSLTISHNREASLKFLSSLHVRPFFLKKIDSSRCTLIRLIGERRDVA